MNNRPVYIASPYTGTVEANTAFAINCCRSEDLVSIADVLSLLYSNGANFAGLEPVRERYVARFRNDMCYSFPFWISDYLGCVLLPVQEGILQLPYVSVDSDTYEQFDTGAVRLLTADAAQELMDALITQTADLTKVLAKIQQSVLAANQNPEAVTARRQPE